MHASKVQVSLYCYYVSLQLSRQDPKQVRSSFTYKFMIDLIAGQFTHCVLLGLAFVIFLMFQYSLNPKASPQDELLLMFLKF